MQKTKGVLTILDINNIRNLVIDVIINKLAYKGSHISVDMCDRKLLGETFNLKARDLVKLLFLLEEELSIQFPQNDIVDGKFSTINQIADSAFQLIIEKTMVV